MLAPYLAVVVFWCWLHDAWACILVYHAQILLWSRHELTHLRGGWDARMFWLVSAPGILAGGLAFLLLPAMSRMPVDSWLSMHGLSGMARLLMVPYFGVVHPLLEEAHWSSLRAQPRLGGAAHVLFAGYHVLVLGSLLRLPWVVACSGVLVLASVVWKRRASAAQGGPLIPALSHVIADSSLVIAAVLRAC
jgi:hypothetical protein